MKKFVCQHCGYVLLDDEVPESCPVCGFPQDQFKEKEDAIVLPENPEELTELEKKHIPQIVVFKKCGLIEGCVDVHVKMGEIIHPMLPEHFIMQINFYLDNKLVSNIKLTPENMQPAGCLHLKKDKGKLSVISHCNLHGNWMSETEL